MPTSERHSVPKTALAVGSNRASAHRESHHRAEPFSIRARLSRDGGRSWDGPVTLRGGGGGRDIGYPRTVQRPDGKLVTVYYFWDRRGGPERYVAATVWSPGP